MGQHFLDSLSSSAALKSCLTTLCLIFLICKWGCWRDWVSSSESPSTYALISKSVKVHEEPLEEKLRGVGSVGVLFAKSRCCVPDLEMEFGSESLLVSLILGSTFPSPLGSTAERTDSCLECSATFRRGGGA